MIELDESEEANSVRSERYLRGAIECQQSFEALAEIHNQPHLRHLLNRWQLLGYPRPKVRILEKTFSEWSPEFEQFLDLYSR